MKSSRILITKPRDPFADEIASRLARKKAKADPQRPVEKRVEVPEGYVAPGIIYAVADAIRSRLSGRV